MKYFKDFQSFKKLSESIDGYELPFRIDLKESITTDIKDLLSSIGAEELDLCNELHINPEEIDLRIDLENFVESDLVLDSLSKLELRLGDVEKTSDSQTFLSAPIFYVCLYSKGSSDLENPSHVFIQQWQNETKNRTHIKMYKVQDNFLKFYDRLSSKTVEVEIDNKKLIYKTDNSGNNWTLQIPVDGYENNITSQEMWDLMKDKNVKVKVLY